LVDAKELEESVRSPRSLHFNSLAGTRRFLKSDIAFFSFAFFFLLCFLFCRETSLGSGDYERKKD